MNKQFECARFAMLASVLFLTACTATGQNDRVSAGQENRMSATNNHSQLFEQLITAAGDAFAMKRRTYFSDPIAVEYLKQRMQDTNPVQAFCARELYLWAKDDDKAYAKLEHFLTVTEPALRESNKTAAGGGGSRALSGYLGPITQGNAALEEKMINHLLLRLLLQPNQHQYIMVFLQQYFAVEAPKDPQVWIRIILNLGDEKIYQFIADKTLSQVPRLKLIAALNAEKKRTLAEGKTWPAEFESLLHVRKSR